MEMHVLTLLTFLAAGIAASQSVFRQLSASEWEEIELRHDPELLTTAARTGESVNIVLNASLIGALVQEGVNVNIDCLPWLQDYPGGTIHWERSLFQINSTGHIVSVGKDIQ